MLGKKEPNWLALDRRLFCLGALQGAVFTVLGARLYQLQMVHGFSYRLLSDKRRISIRFIQAPRGIFTDRKQTILALQKNTFQAFLSLPARKKYHPALLDPLVPMLALSDQDKAAIAEDYTEGKRLLLKEKLTWEEVSVLETQRDRLPYVTIEVHSMRHYCFPKDFSHVLGYVSMSKEKNKPYKPFYIGKSGLEKLFEERLRGRNGYKAMAINACNQPLQVMRSLSPTPGEGIQLSLDQGLQQFVAQRLSEYPAACVVVMKSDTGEILSMVSHPGFDANIFSHRISKSHWSEMIKDPYAPLLNRALSGLYPPGSLVKVAMALAGLQSGLINATTVVNCRGVFFLKNHPFHCWKKHGHGDVTVQEALCGSCDVFFYWLAARLPVDLVTQALKTVGFGTALFSDVSEEKAGLIPTPLWKQTMKKGSWLVADSILRGIGQGAFLANPLQMVTMMARISSGVLVRPTFLYQEKENTFMPLDYSLEHLELVRSGLENAVGDEEGTAYAYRVLENSFQMAGKTATSQVRRISQIQRKAGITTSFHLPWHQREHTLFAGYAPADKPLYTVSVIIEHGIKGAPVVAHDIFVFMKKEGFF